MRLQVFVGLRWKGRDLLAVVEHQRLVAHRDQHAALIVRQKEQLDGALIDFAAGHIAQIVPDNFLQAGTGLCRVEVSAHG